MKLIRVGERRIVLACTERGHVAFDDRCTHKGGPLSDGVLACGTVQCPWHGSQFEAKTGAVAQGPAREPIGTCDVAERDGRLWIRLQHAGENSQPRSVAVDSERESDLNLTVTQLGDGYGRDQWAVAGDTRLPIG
jgi:nitrite reductase/ring-hydroxylating ferredoxin subunit